MSYLNDAGLARFWAAIKSLFVRTVNGVSPDANGNVQISGGSALGNRGVFYGTCSTVAATAEKAVTCNDFGSSDLIPGVIVTVKFEITNSAAVANLTLNVNDTGAKSIRHIHNGSYSTIPGVGYLKADQIYRFTFDGVYWIVDMNYNTNTVPSNLYNGYSALKTYAQLCRNMICLTKNSEYILPVTSVSNTQGTTKPMTTEEFDPFGEIYYYDTTTIIAANGVPGNTHLFSQYSTSLINLKYAFNTGNTLTAGKAIYLVCVPQPNGSAKLAPNPISQDLPEVEDGYVYIKFGWAIDTYRIELLQHKPRYYYSDGAIRLWTNSKATELSVSTEISRKRDDKKTLIVKVNGIENFKGTPRIFVYTCPRRKGTYYWRHPVDANKTVPVDPTTGKKIGTKYGYASLTTGNSRYGSVPSGIKYPPVPDWMPDNGYLRTEFDVPSGSDSIEICIPEWIVPLYKPNGIDLHNNSMIWVPASLMGTRQDRAPILFRFIAVDNYDGTIKAFQSTNATLAVGVRRDDTLDLSDGPDVSSIRDLYISFR